MLACRSYVPISTPHAFPPGHFRGTTYRSLHRNPYEPPSWDETSEIQIHSNSPGLSANTRSRREIVEHRFNIFGLLSTPLKNLSPEWKLEWRRTLVTSKSVVITKAKNRSSLRCDFRRGITIPQC